MPANWDFSERKKRKPSRSTQTRLLAAAQGSKALRRRGADVQGGGREDRVGARMAQGRGPPLNDGAPLPAWQHARACLGGGKALRARCFGQIDEHLPLQNSPPPHLAHHEKNAFPKRKARQFDAISRLIKTWGAADARGTLVCRPSPPCRRVTQRTDITGLLGV